MPEKLTWDNTEEIGILLSNRHPEVHPLAVGLHDLHRYVRELSEFNGDPEVFEEQKLEAIRAAWNAEFLERTQF